MKSTVKSIGIVGGGIAGLALASLLAQRGQRVTVYDAGLLGGKLRRFQVGGLDFDSLHVDTGPSLFTFPGVWRRLLQKLNEADPLDLRPLPGGLGLHHTPFGAVPLPVPPGHRLFPHWQRYVQEVAPLRPHVETLLTTPPRLTSAAFLQASAALGRVTAPHLSAAGWLKSRHFPPDLHHALAVHSLNAGLAPQQASVLYALLPGLIAGEVYRPAAGMGALLDALTGFCEARGVTLRPLTPVQRLPVLPLGELGRHDLLVSAIDPARLAPLLGRPVPDAPQTVSGVAIYARLPTRLQGCLPATSVLTPSSYSRFAAAMSVRALPPDTLALIHADHEQLAVLLTAPASGRAYALAHPWVQGQLRRVEETLEVVGLLDPSAVLTLTPDFFAQGGAVGGAIYGRAYPAWRSGPFHPQPYRLSARLWQVGTGVHPGGGLPAVLGGALIVDGLMAEGFAKVP